MASSDTAVLDRSAIGQATGIWAPALTPLDQDLKPDGARFAAHATWLLETGCHGLAVFGTTGEATSFSVAERIALLEAALAAGLPPERLLVGAGCCALSDTLALTAHAAAVGCKNVLMLPPFYYKDMSDEGLAESFARVIDAVGDPALGVYLYHFPKLSGVPITHGLLARLSGAYPGVIKGVKDSSGDPDSTAGFIRSFPDLAIFPGTSCCPCWRRARPAASAHPATSTAGRSAGFTTPGGRARTRPRSCRRGSRRCARSCRPIP
jgi:4-hydroxy-tetrahydrodipicolinate synthase